VAALLAHEATDVNQARTDNGSTPLYMASQKGHTAVVAALLAHKATDVNQAKKDDGGTPLFMASQQGHTAVVAALLNCPSIKMDEPNNNGQTPLLMATFVGNRECVEALLAAGADHQTPTPFGRVADVARQKGHYAIAALLGN
jgi:serine/threonine-protein phosphatase 6 regulatory ankyrin repeat subunit B